MSRINGRENVAAHAPKAGGTLSRLLGYVGRGRNRWAMLGVLLFALLGNTALMLAPRLIGEAIDRILPGAWGTAAPALLRILAVIAVLYLLGAGLNWLTALSANQVANRTVRALRSDLFKKLGRMPLRYFDSHSRGDMMSRFSNDIDAISDGLNQGIVQLVSGVITVILSLAFMLSLNPLVALVAVLVTPLCFVVGYFITRYGSRRFREQSRTLGLLNGCAEELITGQHTVKAFGYEQRANEKFRALNQELYEAGYRAQFASALVNPSTRFVNNIAYVLVGVFGILAVLRGALSVGGVASFLTYTAQFSKPFNDITAITMQLQQAMASSRRIFAVMDAQELQPEPDGMKELRDVQGKVAFRDVFFSYTPERPLIEHFTLDARPGTTVAIVGPTGAGKTTMVNLLMRFFEVNSGRITIDGVATTDLRREDVHELFGMVLQDTWLFEGTIRENLVYNMEGITDEQLETVCKACGLDKFVHSLPQGFDTVLSESTTISAGQKQLLTIARAMLQNAPMLILDEATSSVDTRTELLIQRAMDELTKGRTSFVIAHRLSTIKNADLILVMRDGDVIESGTHEQLMEQNGFYAELYNSQFAQAS